MALVSATMGIALALGIIGLAIFLSKPSRPVNALLGVLLLLWAAGTAVYPQLVAARDAQQAALLARVTVWYSLPAPFVAAWLALAVGGRPLRRGPASGALVAAGLATGAAAIAFALDASTFVDSVTRIENGTWAMRPGPLLYVLAAATAVAVAAAVLSCARVVRDHPEPIARQRAAWIGASLALILAHGGAYFLVYTALFPRVWSDPYFLVRAVATTGALLAVVPVAPRLARGIGGAPGQIALVVGGVLAVLGALDGVISANVELFLRLPGYAYASVFVRFPVALGLAIAALRFGLADLGRSERERIRRLAAGGLALALGAIVVAASVALLGLNLVGGLVALVAAPAAPWLARDALGRAAGAITRGALLPSDDPAAVAQRARAYASALAASTGPDGRVLPEGEKLLAQMRLDLGVTDREHELLLRGLQSRAPPDDPLALGRYRLEEELGRGSTARVHLASDVETGARVVVKRFSQGRHTAEVLREARVLLGLSHPRLLRLVEVDRRGDDVFLVTEHAARGSARDELDAKGPLPPARAVALAADLLEGLEALHAAGLVHRDVKPENLLIDAQGRGLLGDLGSAQPVAPADATVTGTQATGASLSTVAPEVLRGAPATERSDLYAAGATLYRLLTGRHYVDLDDASGFDAQQRILLDAPRLDDPRVPIALRPLLARALAKRPEERYPTAREMRDALASVPLVAR